MNGEPIFADSGRWWLGGCGVALAVVLLFMIFGQPAADEPKSVGTDAFSRSFVGYRALVELLGEQLPVRVARFDPAGLAAPTHPLLVLEPPTDSAGLARLRQILDAAQRRGVPVVVILPKWDFATLSPRPGWVGAVRPRDEQQPALVLRAILGVDDDNDRVYRSGTRLADSARVASKEPRFRELAGLALELPLPQVLTQPWPGLEPIVTVGPALVLVKVRGREVYVVTDPDLWNTGGLGRADHATLLERLLVGTLGAKGLIVDASFQFPAPPRNIWRTLLDFPLVCVTLHLSLLLALALWASCFRFGRPLAPPPRIAPGKLALIDNTARLLALSDDLEEPALRYLQLTVRQAAERWAVPAELGFKDQVARLARLARARGVRSDLTVLARQVDRLLTQPHDARRVLALARALHRWRREALDAT